MERIGNALFQPLSPRDAARAGGGAAAPLEPYPSTFIMTECFLLDGTVLLDCIGD